MKTIADWTSSNLVRVLAYGKSKVGKTFGALTFPRPCVMDFDRGIGTARNPEFVKRYGVRDIKYEQFYDTKRGKGGVVTSHNAFDDACKFFDLMMSKEHIETFDTWVVDSGTTLSEAAQNKAIILLGTSAFSGAKSETHKQALAHGLVVPKLQDYGAERSMVEQFVDMLLSTDKHIVFICHEKEISNKDGQLTTIAPLLTGKGVEAVCLRFDEVYNVRAEGNVRTRSRTILTDSDGIRVAGSRYGVPTGSEFTWDAIKEALDSIRADQLNAVHLPAGDK